VPFLIGLARLRFRRVFAIAKLSFKEAVRRRVLYVFGLLLVVFLFGSWFITSRPADQLRTYVNVVFFVMSFLLLVASAIISAFSIPADIKQQTIHTVVTKPVERFEIVLGRFLGFLALMTLALIVMTSLSLVYILRGVNPEAAAESLKARHPLYGELAFENVPPRSDGKAINVGREWEYRSYITYRSDNRDAAQAAHWDISGLPAAWSGLQQPVTVEYTFDVFRTTKGKEGADVTCFFSFETWRSSRAGRKAYRDERKNSTDPQLLDRLAEKYGYHEEPAQPVTDFRTQDLRVPAGLFRNALGAAPDAPLAAQLRVRVTCNTRSQYVGMAKHDLFLRLDSGQGDVWLFALNFYKAAFGLWLQIALVIALSVVLSTYLHGVNTLLVTVSLFVGGFSHDFIKGVAYNPGATVGPLESMRMLLNRQVVSVKTTQSDSAGDRFVNVGDEAFRWMVRRILNVLPDMDRYGGSAQYLAEGFNIPAEQLLLTALMLLGYLIPWFVLAYYLLRWREVAAAT
jgi:ABC-type transport system involved in multi-copper enzyme maturation permease subunit